jgi:hypothetical protein
VEGRLPRLDGVFGHRRNEPPGTRDRTQQTTRKIGCLDNRAKATFEVVCANWSCDQNPGRKPAISRRAYGARDEGAPANRIQLAGPAFRCR